MKPRADFKQILYIMAVIAAVVFLASIFVATIDFGADDAQGYNWIYERYELGERPDGSSLFNPMLAMLSLLYFLNIGDNGALLCSAYCAVWYFGCVAMTMLLALRKTRSNKWWLLSLASFMFVPSATTNRWHLVPTFAALLSIYFITLYRERKNRLFLFLAAAVSVYTLLTVNDRVLFIVFVPVPLAVWGIIWCLHDRERHKYLYFGALACAVAALLFKILDWVLRAARGNGLSILEAERVYGGSLLWIDMDTLFNKAIPSFFSALLWQYNIRVQGTFMQVMSFFWVIRLFIVALSLAVSVRCLKNISKEGIENMEILDSLGAITVALLTVINLLNGENKFASVVDGWPINRYNSVAWFLLIILLVRWLDKKYEGAELKLTVSRKLSSEFVLAVVFTCLAFGYAAYTVGIHGKNPSTDDIKFLDQSGGIYKYGFASWWKCFPVTAHTNGRYVMCHGWISRDEADQDIYYLQGAGNDCGNLTDGSNIFNFILSDLNNPMTLNEENINRTRGDYIDRNTFGSSDIYLYDYDIRWAPRLIMEAVGVDYELTDDIEYYFDFPVGTNRVEMDVANSGNFELGIGGNEDVEDFAVTMVNDNKIYVDLVCRQNTAVTFKVARKDDETTTIHKIVLKRVRGAVEVAGNEIYLKEGSYVVTINGSGLDRADTVFEGEGIAVKRLTDGRIKNRYQVDVAFPQTVKFKTTGKGISVNGVFYENTDLFDGNSINIDAKYLWNM